MQQFAACLEAAVGIFVSVGIIIFYLFPDFVTQKTRIL